MGPLDRILQLVGLGFELDLDGDPFDRVAPGLFLGSRPGPDDVAVLVEAGVTGVVSCLPERERTAMAFLDERFETWFIPIHDGMHEDIRAGMPVFEVAAAAVLPEGRLLVHCEVGVSRSATHAIAHVMRTSGLRFFEAYEAVRAARPQVLPNIGFATALQWLEDELQPPRPPPAPSSLARYLVEVCRVPADIAVVDTALAENGNDAYSGIRSVFGGEIPRVVQGVRLR